MATPRWVIVDDGDPGIQYTGPWFEAHSDPNNLGNGGPPFQGTLHAVTEDASFSYTFNGKLNFLFFASVL
jgi:hypothetical protein